MSRLLLRDLEPGALYKLQFRAKNADTVSEWSQLFDLQTNGDTVAPPAPSALSWTVQGTAFVGTWTGNNDTTPDFKDFQVTLYSSAAPATKAIFYTAAPRYDFSFESNVNAFGTPRASVTIEVRSRDNSGNLSAAVTATATNPAPSNVTGFVATGITDAISLKWTSVTDTDLKFYRVRQGTSAGAVNTIVYEGRGTSAVWDTVSTVANYFSVVAVDVFNTESATPATANATAKSSLAVDTTPPAAPTGVTVTPSEAGGIGKIKVAWTGVADTDLQNYTVRWSESTTTDWRYITTPEGIVNAVIDSLTPGLSYNVAVNAVDYSGNASAWVNAGTYPVAIPNAAPSTPAAPTVAANSMQAQISHNGKMADGTTNLEADVEYFEVHSSTTTGFATSAATLIGTIQNGPGIVGTFPVPATASSGTSQTWYYRVIAVDKMNQKSAASAQATATVNLISTTNIGDAVITDAKIGTISANKITAGTGIVNNLLIKATLTVDTAGIISSTNYSAGVAGYRLTNNSLEINDGTIQAKALLLQNGPNLLPAAYAGFEFAPNFYDTFGTGKGINTAGLWSTVADTTVTARFETQYLKINYDTSNAGPHTVKLNKSDTDYNVPMDPNTPYIFSIYLQNPTATAQNYNIYCKTNDGVTLTAVSGSLPATSGWTRVSATFSTAVSTVTAGYFYLDFPDTVSTFYMDGAQVERKTTGQTTPSVWRPPGVTSVDGGVIRTGEIRSTAGAAGLSGQPAWSINTQGNAQFGDALVRGRLIVGDPNNVNADGANSRIYSANFVSGSAGWQIDASGNVEFNSGVFRGTLGANTVTTKSLTIGVISTNLLKNPGFEETAPGSMTGYVATQVGWGISGRGGFEYSSGGYGPKTGKGKAVITSKDAESSYMKSDPIAVTAGSTYTLMGWAGNGGRLAARINTGNALDANGNVTTINSFGDNSNDFNLNGSAYTPFSQVVTIPTGHTYAQVLIYNYQPATTGGLTAATDYYLCIDDVSFTLQGYGSAELSPSGLRLFDTDGNISTDLTSSSAGGAFATFAKGLAAISDDGSITGTGVSATDDFYPQGNPLIGGNFFTYAPGWVNGYANSVVDAIPRGIVAHDWIGIYYTMTSTEIGMVGLDFPVEPNRMYRISGMLRCKPGAAAVAEYLLRYTTDGSVPKVTSARIQMHDVHMKDGGWATLPIDGILRVTPSMVTQNPDGSYVPFRLLLTGRVVGGANGPVIGGSQADGYGVWRVEDIGPYIAETGYANDGGASTAPATKATYTKRFYATWSRSFTGSGAYNSYYGSGINQGYYDSTNGNQRAMIGFDFTTIQSTLSGATIQACKFYAYANHWYYNAGGTAIIGTHNSSATASAPPTTFSGTTNRTHSDSWPNPGGRVVSLGTGIGGEFQAGTSKGIVMGPGPTTSYQYYGKFNGNGSSYEPYLEFTYTK